MTKNPDLPDGVTVLWEDPENDYYHEPAPQMPPAETWYPIETIPPNKQVLLKWGKICYSGRLVPGTGWYLDGDRRSFGAPPTHWGFLPGDKAKLS